MSELFVTDLFGAQSGCNIDVKNGTKYRYCLYRIWDSNLPLLAWICLNPSTATETDDDPTIRRVRGFASDWGYGGFYMLNLFGIVSAFPEVLVNHPDPIGDNDLWIEKIAPRCSKIVFAWGNFPEAKERAKKIIEMFPEGLALVLNKDGSPRHPLYVPKNTKPIKFKQ